MIQGLFHVLEKLVSLHRHLVDVLEEEYLHMIGVDVQGLSETARTKEVLVAEILACEKLRIKMSDEFSEKPGLKSGDTPTLLDISKKLAESDSKKLKTMREVLNLLMTRAKESNGRNMRFAQKSLHRIETMKKNVLGENNNNVKENYSAGGIRETMGEHGGRLLSTEA